MNSKEQKILDLFYNGKITYEEASRRLFRVREKVKA